MLASQTVTPSGSRARTSSGPTACAPQRDGRTENSSSVLDSAGTRTATVPDGSRRSCPVLATASSTVNAAFPSLRTRTMAATVSPSSSRVRSSSTSAARCGSAASSSPAPANTRNGTASTASSGRPLARAPITPPAARASRPLVRREMARFIVARAQPASPRVPAAEPQEHSYLQGTAGPGGRCPIGDRPKALARRRPASDPASGRGRRAGRR